MSMGLRLLIIGLIVACCFGEMLRFKPPQFSSEEQHSNFMPDHFRCTSCRGIAHQIQTRFAEKHKRRQNQKYRMNSPDLMELVEDVCNENVYDAYGVKSIGGDVRIKGPGIEYEGAGVIAGGQNWPTRMAKMCSQIMENYDEETAMYEAWLDTRNSFDSFVNRLVADNPKICRCDVKKRENDSPLSDKSPATDVHGEL